jgi:exodeoxyribonuclease III
VKLYSWNVNGIRSAVRHGFLDWLLTARPDVLCLQETKADRQDLPAEIIAPPGYESYWAQGQRRGYSGVATYTVEPPQNWHAGLGVERLDVDARVVVTELQGFELYNVYFPNGKASADRLQFKFDFYAEFLAQIDRRVATGHPVIFCGDVNTAHKEIDIARPKENRTVSGFLPEECACLDTWVESGWVDSFRYFHPQQADAYSWWSMRTKARERNIGWRLDYFFVHESLMPRVRGAGIDATVFGADHCPVWLEID